MPRRILALTLFVLILTTSVRAQDLEPSYQNKSLSQWLEILNGGEELAQKQTALQALGVIPAHPLAWREMTKRRQAALLIVEAIGPVKHRKLIPGFITTLSGDPEESFRAGAATALGRLRSKCKSENVDFTAARDALFAAARTDKSAAVREAAVIAIGKLETQEARPIVPTLIELLKDENTATRAAAADTLRRLGRDALEAVPGLTALLDDDKADRLSRYQAALALGKIGPPEASTALPTIKKVLADEAVPIDVRSAAAKALSRFGKAGADAVPMLGKLLSAEGTDAELRREVIIALEELGPDAKPALDDLKKSAKNRDKFVRGLVLRTLAKVARENPSSVKEIATLLYAGSDDAVVEVRIAAVESLGNIGAEALGSELKEVRDRLEVLSNSTDKTMQEAAKAALEKLKPAM